MNLPLRIAVGPMEYQIVRSVAASEKLSRAALMGESDHYDGVIRLQTGLPRQQLNETFWHEVCHCVDYVMLNNRLDENEIACLARGFYHVVKQLGIEFEP